MVLLPGDRYILRGFAMQRHHGTTVGGGVVLRTLGRRLRRNLPAELTALREQESALATGDVDSGVRLEVARAGDAGLTRAALQARSAFSPRAVDAALTRASAARSIIRYDKERGALIAAAALQSLKDRALAAVAAHHAAQPLAAGLPREELRGTLTRDVKLLHATLEALAQQGALVVEREIVRQPSHDPAQRRAQAGRAPLADRARPKPR
jgi:selenocysteine-specific elongation factor